MSKSSSGLFSGTKGAGTSSLGIDETTAAVWEQIKSTADNYPNSQIPRSFEVDVPKTPATPDGKMWTHGNATKHMHEAMISLKEVHSLRLL